MRLVHGRAPAGLSGTLFRNGPGKFRRPGGARHPLVRRRRPDPAPSASATAGATARRPLRRHAQAPPGDAQPAPWSRRASAPPATPAPRASAAPTTPTPPTPRSWSPATRSGRCGKAARPAPWTPRPWRPQGFVTLRDDLKGMPFRPTRATSRTARIWNFGLNGGAGHRLAAVGRRRAARPPRSSTCRAPATCTTSPPPTATWSSCCSPGCASASRMPVAAGFAWKPELGTQVLVLDKADLSRRRVYELPDLLLLPPRRRLGGGRRDHPLRRLPPARPDLRHADRAPTCWSSSADRAEPARRAGAHRARTGRQGPLRADLGTIAEFPKTDPRLAGLPRTPQLSTAPASVTDRTSSPHGIAVDRHWDTAASTTSTSATRTWSRRPLFVAAAGSSAEGDGWLVAPSSTCATASPNCTPSTPPASPTARSPPGAPTWPCRPASTACSAAG